MNRPAFYFTTWDTQTHASGRKGNPFCTLKQSKRGTKPKEFPYRPLNLNTKQTNTRVGFFRQFLHDLVIFNTQSSLCGGGEIR